MRMEDVHNYFDSKKTGATGSVSHVVVGSPAYQLHTGDDEASLDQFARFVYEANRLKDPQPVRELMSPTFAMHFSLEIKGEAADAILKEVASALGKSLFPHYPTHETLTCVIFAAKLTGFQKGQIVFPDILVDADRHRMLRMSAIEDIQTKNANIVMNLTKQDVSNSMVNVVKELDQKNGVEVPLCATTRHPMIVHEAPLNPVALARITQKAVQPVPPPDNRWEWVLLGVKRRVGPEAGLTEWVAPRQFRKGAAGEGSSGKSSSAGTTGPTTQGATGYSQGGQKHGK